MLTTFIFLQLYCKKMRTFLLLLLMLFCFCTSYSQCATVPSITSFAPASGPAGTTVIITGNNFDPVAANNTIFFGNAKTTATTATSTSIQVIVPAGATAQFLSVNKSCGATAMLQYGFRIINPCAGPIVSGAFSSVTSYPAVNRGYSAALGDLDGDGKPEMVVANYINQVSPFNPTSISVYRNQSTPGTVSYADSVSYQVGSTQLYGVFIFDIDMDGRPDIIAHSGGTALYIFRNVSTAPGTITLASRQDYYPANGSWAITFGDMDNDGKPDIIYGGNSKAWIIRNTSVPGLISFDAAFSVQMNDPAEFCNTTDVKVGDLDGDGKNDIVTANYNCSKVGVCRNLSTPGLLSFGTYFTFTSSGQTHGVAIGDLNNDGKPEIVAVNRSVSTSHIFQNQNSGALSAASFMSPVNIGSGASTVLIQDVNGDGKPDILCSNGGGVSIYSNSNATGATITGASFGAATGVALSCGGTARMFDIGDVDGDGYLDMVSGRDANYPNAKGEITRRIPSPGFTGLVPATTLNVTANCNDNTWKYSYDPLNTDKLLLSVKDNGLNLGAITANVYADVNAGTYNGQRYMRRHYLINSSLNPVGTRRVRLYYTTADFANLQTVIPGLNTASQLSVTGYSGAGEDGIYNPQPGGILTMIPKTVITTGTAYGQSFLEFDVTGFGEFWIHTGVFVLPADLFSFQAQKCNREICLQWKTENEQQVSHFETERSLDANHFTFIEKIAAKNQLYNSYSGTDNINIQSTVYYRVRQVNVDGSFKYSQVISIRPDKKTDITVSPNPVKNLVKITASNTFIKNLQIINTVGQVLKTWQPSAGNLYDLGSFPDGVYLIKVFAGDMTETIRVFVYH